jgi:hypothetical protein
VLIAKHLLVIAVSAVVVVVDALHLNNVAILVNLLVVVDVVVFELD